MKKTIIALVFYYSLFITHYSLCQWVWQNPYPSGNPLRGVKFLNDNTGIAVGLSETILRTTNGGSNWSIQNFSFRYNKCHFNSVCFINSQTGWISGYTPLVYEYPREGVVIKTTNGGINWYSPTLDTLYPLYSIQFVNSQTGYALGCSTNSIKRLYKSTNGGNSWIYNNNINYFYLNYYNIYFINENTGFLSNFITTNGGTNWSQYLTSNDYIVSNYFIDSYTGWALNRFGKIFKTTNTGSNWIMTKIDTTRQFNSVEFADANTGWVYGNNGAIYKTTNGGSNWIIQNSNTGLSLYASSFLNPAKGWMAGDDGKTIKTTDGGNTWTSPVNIDYYDLNAFQALNENYAWSVGSGGVLLCTTNGGINWIYKQTGKTNNLLSVCFVNQNTGWVGDLYGNILKTTNNGLNWNTIKLDSTNYLYNVPINFINETTGWAAIRNNIWKTTNAGINWGSYQINLSAWISSIQFISPNIGFASLKEGYFAKTTNGGVNWFFPFNGQITSYYFNSMYFINEQTGWIACNRSYIYKTTNSGINWTAGFYSNAENYLYAIKFVNELTGWCAGMYGTILKTTNGGTNWISQYSGTANHLYSITFIDNTTGYVCGQGNSILKTTNGGNVFVKNISTEIPSSFSLSQNYPNPFNPTTSIKYQVESIKYIKLSVYDILGKEISTLVNEKQSPGSYEVSWDASAYPSGVYFYKLIAGDFSEVKKAILIK